LLQAFFCENAKIGFRKFFLLLLKIPEMKKTILFIVMLLPLFSFGQDDAKWGIKFSGFVKNDFFFDTRQVETLREGHFLLYPLNVKYDRDSADINAQPSFNMLSIQSRLRGEIAAPDALGAKTSGVLEAEFFGTSNADINGFRLRHAYVKLNWPSTELLVGQTFPMWCRLIPVFHFSRSAATLKFDLPKKPDPCALSLQ
jgi:hypothetical protein